MKWVGSVPVDTLALGTPVQLRYPPFDVVVVQLADGVFAIEDACNHAGASLAAGDVDASGCIRCPMHGYRFSMRSGALVVPKGLCGDQRTFVVTREGTEFHVWDDGGVELRGP